MKKKLLAILTAGLLACSVGLVACGHTCVYDQEITGSSTLAQAATCTSPAYYYYSCECGNVSADEMFEDGELAAHVFTAETVNDDALLSSATCTAQAMYYKSCANCGAISTNMDDVFSTTGLLPHTYTAETVKDSAKKADATCQAPSTYYKSCSTCGEVSTNAEDVFETGSLANHNYDASNEYLCSFGCGCKKLSESRVGEDANTLYFFDKANGGDQLTVAEGVTKSYSTEVKFGTEAGSLALTVDNIEDPEIAWHTLGYEFNEGDYVVFYVYNDSDFDAVDISLGYTHKQTCYNGQWTMVLWKASDVINKGDDWSNDWSYLSAKDYNGDYEGMTWGNLNGTVYFSKAKVYSADQVADLTTVEDTYEYTVGNTTLIGKAVLDVTDVYEYNPDAFNDAFFLNPHFVNGVLAYNINDKVEDLPLQIEDEPIIELTLKDAYDLENCYVYMTIKGAVEEDVWMQAFSTTGHFGSPEGGLVELVETKADGSQVYKFNLAYYANDGGDAINFKSFRLYVRKGLAFPITGQVVISDITVVNETPQA